MSFLLNYSVSKGSHLKLQSILEPTLLRDLVQYCDQAVQDTVSMIRFQEHLYYTTLLQLKLNESLFMLDQHVVPKLSGFFAMTVALMLDIVPEALHSRMISVISNWRQLLFREKTSSIEHFAFIVLYLYNIEMGDLNLDHIEVNIDLDLKMSLGLEMARYQRAPEAAAILGSCVKDLDIAGCIGSRECCIITTELVKCYNMMNEEVKGETLARHVLGLQRAPQLEFQHDLCHLNLALADTLMGQGEYRSAETLMLDLLAVESLPRRTQTIIRLRLNKARRRLGHHETITLVEAGFMQPVLESITYMNQDMKTEVLAELSATASLAAQEETKNFERVTDLIHETVVAIARSSDVLIDWRINSLVQDLKTARSMEEDIGKEVVTESLLTGERMDENIMTFSRRLLTQAGLEVDSDDRLLPTQRRGIDRTILGGLFSSREKRLDPWKQDASSGRSSSNPLSRLISRLKHPMEKKVFVSSPSIGRSLAPSPESSSSPNPGPYFE